ncbi:microtubule integrity protein mal3 [Saitoella coloradoensis]
MGESRQELIGWLNQLLHLQLTKVEQCGTGAPLCQVFDSIYGDVPMSRVKFDCNAEYQYLANFKILQNTFAKHGITQGLPVERLVKCRFQDNLEFLQWVKRYWDAYYPGGEYDAVGRRAGKPGGVLAPVGGGGSVGGGTRRVPSSTASRSTTSATRAPSSTSTARAPSASSTAAASTAALQKAQLEVKSLTTQLTESHDLIASLERERDFYFGKLRDIEVLVQEYAATVRPEEAPEVTTLVGKVQGILYETEEGFEAPETETEEEGLVEGVEGIAFDENGAAYAEEDLETF